MAKSEKTTRAPQTASADVQTSGSMPTRRSTLAGLAATACGCQALPMFSSQAQAASDDPASMSPQVGDRFTYLHGDKVGQAIKPEDLPLGRDQKLVYPMDPATGVVRDGSRFNMMLLIRLDPEELDDETSPNAAEGVVAYSAVCTHHGCPVSMWSSKGKTLFCSCHGTEYNPAAAAEVVAGPAPRRLPMMPVTLENGEIVVAGKFTSRVGSQN